MGNGARQTEPPRARQAFEDYVAMGEGRSLDRLWKAYRERQEIGSEAATPTRRFRTLADWSTRYRWQERLANRERELAEAAWAKQKGALVQRRVKQLDALRRMSDRFLERIDELAVMGGTADLERVLRLEWQVAGEPLADRHEIDSRSMVRVVELPVFGGEEPSPQPSRTGAGEGIGEDDEPAA